MHHIAGPRPLLISELGADSLRNGEEGQSALVRMQLQTALREGACGAVVFTWTDDWWRGGRAVDDWAFGLVDADRRPKPAYRTVQEVFRAPVHAGAPTPRVSVVVCAYNAAATIDECLDALEQRELSRFRGHRRQRRVDGRHRCCRGARIGQSASSTRRTPDSQPRATSVFTTRPARSSPTPTPTCASILNG